MEENEKIEPEQTSENIPEVEQSEIPPSGGEIIAADETIIEPTELQTKEMETHAHQLHHASGKKFRHYLFEFFMLFLAVFCGFLAEYQLEHVIENNREKQFMKSMVEDLEKDIFLLEEESKLVRVQYVKLDSLTEIIYKGTLDPFQVKKLYELQRKYLYPINLRLINRTESQLKNSGGMRLIRNKLITDSIIYYWSMTELLYETKDAINIHRGKAKDISFSLFNNKYYKHTEDFSLDFPLNPIMGDPQLITRNTALLSEFANRISHMNDLLKFNYKFRRVDRQADNAKRIIQLIKKEYRLN